MATIAVCPGCQSQLGVPSDAPTGAELVCPLCQKQFAATPDCVRVLAVASVAPIRVPAPTPPADPLPDLSLPPDAALEPAAAAPPPAGEVEVDFDLAAISATTSLASQPTVTWDAKLPPVETTPTPAAAATPPDETRRLAGDWSSAADAVTPLPAEPRVAPAAAESSPAPADDESTDYEFDAPDFEHDEEDDAVQALDFAGVAGGADSTSSGEDHEFDLSPAARPRRRRSSPLGTLVGIVGGGGIGLLLAGYALLWLTDPPLDLFRMANWAPPSVLPGSLAPQADASQWADDTTSGDSAAIATDDAAIASTAETAGNPPDSDVADPSTADLVAQETTDDAAADAAPPAALVSDDEAVTPASASEPVAAEPPAAPVATPAAAKPLVVPAKWPSTPIVRDLVTPNFVSLADFTASIANVDAAGRQFVAGDLANVDSRRSMGQAYVQLCEVAARFTLTDPADYGSDLFTKQALAKAVLRNVAGNTKRRQDLNVVGARWWQHAKRTNNGLLIVGRVTELTPRGPWTEHMLEVQVGNEVVQIPVLMERVLFASGDEAAVAGAIIANPREQIRGYDGDAPQIVIAGSAFDPALFANDSTGDEKVIDPLKL